MIIRGGALGDFVLTTPVLQALRRAYPSAAITLLANPHALRLARAFKMADEVLSFDSADAATVFSASGIPPGSKLGRIMLSNELVLSYLHDLTGTVERNLRAATQGRVVTWSPLVMAGHAADHFMKPLAELGIAVDNVVVPSLEVTRDLVEAGMAALAASLPGVPPEKVCVIHPGSGSPKKNRPLAEFVEIARASERDGLYPLFLAGEAEHAMHSLLSSTGFPVLADLAIETVAGVLARCGAYYGNDSGITHLAAAVGAKVTVLITEGHNEAWTSRGAHVTVVRQ